MQNRRVVTNEIPILIIACSLLLGAHVREAYADDISGLLDQATSTCREAEATAGQSFGCQDFGSLYSGMSATNQMPSQTQGFNSAVSQGMNLLNNFFGSGFQGVQRQMGQAVQQAVNQEIQKTINQELQNGLQNQQAQQATYQQQQRQLYDSYALKRTGMGRLMGFIPKSTHTSQAPYHMSPYHSQRNPLYEDPGPPGYNGDHNSDNQPSDSQSKHTGGSTPFFGLGGNPRPQLVNTDPQVVDLRNPAVPAALDQGPIGGKELVQKNPNSFDFDGTGRGDNRVFFKQPPADQARPYEVASRQAQTMRSPGPGTDFVKQSGDYVGQLLQTWGQKIGEQIQSSNFTAKGSVPLPLETAMEANKDKKPLIGNLKCNFFAGSIGKDMGVPYFASYPKVDQANRIYQFIRYSVGDPKTSGWREITPKEAQQLANKGKFVIAVAESKDPKGNGHIAVAAPDYMSRDKTSDTSDLPWVRDNNHPELSVRANWAFGSLRNTGAEQADTGKPIWAVWEGP